MIEKLKFGEYLKFLIKEKGFTLVAFKKEIGLSKTYIVDIEKGLTFPTPEMQHKIIKILQLSEDEKALFFDKAAVGRKELPADIQFYLASNPEEIIKIRERMRR